jgi:hypothetical protein
MKRLLGMIQVLLESGGLGFLWRETYHGPGESPGLPFS